MAMNRLLFWVMRRAGAKAPARIDESTGARIATYTPVAKVFAWVILVGVVALATLVLTGIERSQLTTMGILFGAFVAAGVAMVLEFHRVRAEWTDVELTFTSPWGGTRRLRWTDLKDVQYSHSAGWFVVRGQDGTKVRLGQFLGGTTDLFNEMKERAPGIALQVDRAVAMWKGR